MDILTIFSKVVFMLENIGTPTSPEFSFPVPFISNPGHFKLARLGILGHCLSNSTKTLDTLVDIDADGDLDLFSHSHEKDSVELSYFRNEGTTEQPVYVKKNPQEEFGFPDGISNYIFKDIDRDGDQDFWSQYNSSPVFFENTGNPEKAAFVQQTISPIKPLCHEGSGLGFIVDLNNDGQWDMLCEEKDGAIEYFESSISGFLPKRNLLINTKIPLNTGASALDVDLDGDMDIIMGNSDVFVLFTNFGSSLLPQYDRGKVYPFQLGEVADLDGDGDFDIIERETLAYANNIGSNITPAYELAKVSTELEQCNDSFIEIADANKVDQNSPGQFSILDIALVDIDGDNDLDLFSYLEIPGSNEASSKASIFCENVGSATSPLFAPGELNAWSLNVENPDSSVPNIFFSDMDGDGDHDTWIGSVFYDNVGNSKEPLFLHQENLLFYPDEFNTTLVDIDADGRVDSILNHDSRLVYKGLEPATDITTAKLSNVYGDIVIATNRPSQVQLQTCDIKKENDFQCQAIVVLPDTAKKLSLSIGDLTGNGEKDIVLAMIDAEGYLKVKVFDGKLTLIGSGAGGIADSVSVTTGQLDTDPEDEYIVSLVQADNRVAAIAFNLDGSRLGKVVANKGKQPSVDAGNIGRSGNANVVLAYLTMDDRLETAVYKRDGTLISQTTGGSASHVTVSTADISSSFAEEEYIVSLVQSDGTVALISFAADGTRLNKIVGGISHQPKVISGKSVLAVSVILSDKKPAIIFLDYQGKHLGTGVGGVTASVSTIELIDTNNDGIDDAGVLVYIDVTGNPRIGVYDFDGKKRQGAGTE